MKNIRSEEFNHKERIFMKMKYFKIDIILLLIMFLFVQSFSQKLWAEDDDSRSSDSVDTHGFLGQAFTKSIQNNYLNNSILGSFEFTEGGFNLTKTLADNFKIGGQLFVYRIGTLGNFAAQFDWLTADYFWKEQLSFRFGRNKIPMGFYNEVSDADTGRAAVLLPQSVYPLADRNFLFAQDGVELYGNFRLGSPGRIEYRLYGGTLFYDLSAVSSSSITVSQTNVPYVYGGRLLWESQNSALRAALSGQSFQLNLNYTIAGITSNIQLPATLALGSVEYNTRNFTFTGEYGQWWVGFNSSSSIFPAGSVISDRGYVQVDYNGIEKIIPGIYYAVLHSDITNPNVPGGFQNDVATYVRFDVTKNWFCKVEYHSMNGTAYLDPTINNNQALSALNPNWGILLLKTTAYF